MKKKLLLWFATILFWIGDLFGRLLLVSDYRWVAGCYQWFMQKSINIQDKYNLDGPWKDIQNK